MSAGSVDDLVEEMKEIEERSRCQSTQSRKRKHEEDFGYLYYFPVLDFPNEIITHIFSFLSIEDRLKMRLNKRLNAIELESKYFVKSLTIGELCIEDMLEHQSKKNNLPYDMYRNEQEIMLGGKEYSIDFLKRISQNASIGQLKIKLRLTRDLNAKIYKFAKNFNAEHVILDATGSGRGTLMMYSTGYSRPSLLDFSDTCKQLDISSFMLFCRIGPADLHELYKIMIDGSTKLRVVNIGVPQNCIHRFLSLAGITFDIESQEFSSSRGIEAFKYCIEEDEVCHSHFFIRNMEISFKRLIGGVTIHRGCTLLTLKFHDSPESLQKAKCGGKLVKLDLVEE